MEVHEGVIEGTAQKVMAALARMPPGERVRLLIGRPSLSLIARQLQAVAATNGMTADIHDDLLELPEAGYLMRVVIDTTICLPRSEG